MDRSEDNPRRECGVDDGLNRRSILLGGASLVALTTMAARATEAQAEPGAPAAEPQASGSKPNILVIWGDDIGISNLSCYSHGLMGYKTPNIDRIAKEGMMFTDSYGEQSCTAGRSSFITGQSVYRTGLSKVGIPGAPVGMQEHIVTIAACLKNQGYATGQFGKNHLGDLNSMLPTNHGFDEFFGNLYHLNAEEEPELPDYPNEKDFPNFRNRFGPRGVMHSWATDVDDPTEEPRWGKVGKQRVTDTGPLTKKRMETIDDETSAAANRFIGRRPIFTFGNSDGDQQMLEYTQGGGGARLMVLVHHDDAAREFAYGAESHIGTFSDALMAEAKGKHWTVISMKQDWKTVFAFEKK